MLLRNLLSDLNGMLIEQAFEILDMICLEKQGQGNWDIAVARGARVETSSVMFLSNRFVSDTFIHKNMEVLFDVVVKEAVTVQLDVQRIELSMKINIEFNVN